MRYFTSWASRAFICSIMNLCSLLSLCSRATAFSSSLLRISRKYLSFDCKISFAPLSETSKFGWQAPWRKAPGEGWPLQRKEFKILPLTHLVRIPMYHCGNVWLLKCHIQETEYYKTHIPFPHLKEEMHVTTFFLFVSNWAISFWTICMDKMHKHSRKDYFFFPFDHMQ